MSQRGIDIYRWNLKPGAKNHFLDATSGTLAMASWYRFWSNEEHGTIAAEIAPEARNNAKHQARMIKTRKRIRSA